MELVIFGLVSLGVVALHVHVILAEGKAPGSSNGDLEQNGREDETLESNWLFLVMVVAVCECMCSLDWLRGCVYMYMYMYM